jgi:hypothetical protein
MLSIMPAGRHSVRVDFSIFIDGLVGDVDISQSIEFSADEEAKRMILTAGKWKPAAINGKPVVYRYRQPITMAIAEE